MGGARRHHEVIGARAEATGSGDGSNRDARKERIGGARVEEGPASAARCAFLVVLSSVVFVLPICIALNGI